MDQIVIYMCLLAIIAAVGIIAGKLAIPLPLLLVISGMLLSIFHLFPIVQLKPKIVLEVFLPLLVYEASTFASWRDFRKHLRPIAIMSVGHVIFITIVVAITIHTLIPLLGWPMSFVLGAIVSPPDTVAILVIAEKIAMPHRVTTILKGEGLFNDATALILFRFALLAVITHHFYLIDAMLNFLIIVICETFYGLLVGYFIGELRIRVRDPNLQMIFSLLTPFLAYLPPEKLGGSGVLATVVTGFVIGHFYLAHFTSAIRLQAASVWSSLNFIVQSLLFLLIGLNLRYILEGISMIPTHFLVLDAAIIILVVIIGRFIWVYPTAYMLRLLPAERKIQPSLRWQGPFLVSWSGMRGGVSLAAALAIPLLPSNLVVLNSRDLIIFLVFCVIVATLVLQGLALPWIIKVLGEHKRAEAEKYHAHLKKLDVQLEIYKEVLQWLQGYDKTVNNNPSLLAEIKFHINEYEILKQQLEDNISSHDQLVSHDEESELQEAVFLKSKIIEVERKKLEKLWLKHRIDHVVRQKMIEQLDLREKHLK